VVSDEPTVALTIDDDFAAPGAAIAVRARGAVEINGPAGRVTLYDEDEWDDLGLGTWATTAEQPQNMLGLVDWRSGSSSFLEIRTPPLLGGLAFAGVP
jgi:hypothetical protein